MIKELILANQALQNLKKIHNLQKDGEISQILKDLKASKLQVEEFSSNLFEDFMEVEKLVFAPIVASFKKCFFESFN